MMALEALLGLEIDDKPHVRNDLFTGMSPQSDLSGERGMDRYGHVDNGTSILGKKVELRESGGRFIVVIEGIAFEGKAFTSKQDALAFAAQEIKERYGEPVQNEMVTSLYGKKIELRKRSDDKIVLLIEGKLCDEVFSSKEDAMQYAGTQIKAKYGEPVSL
jgi:hypothetical protein